MMAATGPTGAGARASLPHGFDRRGHDHRAAVMGWARRASNGNSKIAPGNVSVGEDLQAVSRKLKDWATT